MIQCICSFGNNLIIYMKIKETDKEGKKKDSSLNKKKALAKKLQDNLRRRKIVNTKNELKK